MDQLSSQQRSYAKPALTFEEQLSLLEHRGMIVADRKAALRTLSHVSYYRLSEYWRIFREEDDTFRSGTTFEEVVSLYEYDRRLRLCVMDGIERVEVCARTAITYVMAHAHGPFAFSDACSFKQDFDHKDWREKLEEEIDRAKDSMEFLKHYRKKYDGFPRVPIWIATEVMTLGPLSRIFKKGLAEADVVAVSNQLGVHPSIAPTWLHSLSIVRNICAHHGRLWNRHLGVRPKLPKNDPKWVGIHPARVYATLRILRQLTLTVDGGTWWKAASTLLGETDGKLDMQSHMNVPRDWGTR